MSGLRQRAEGYGVVGVKLLSLEPLFPDAFKGYGTGSFVQDLVKLQSSVSELRRHHPLLPMAISLLALPFPLQIPVSLSDMLTLVREGGGLPFNYVDSAARAPPPPHLEPPLTPRSMYRPKALSSWFPVKKHAAAPEKVNVKLPELLLSMKRMGRGHIVRGILALCAHRLSEDQVLNAVIYGSGLSDVFGPIGWDIAVHFLLAPATAKNVSVALKALGAQTTREGALLVEADTLQGRLAGPVDLDAESRYRCDPQGVASKVIDQPDVLRPHIRAIVDAELRDRQLDLPDLHSWWSSRWLWCVNGSQTTASSLALGIDPKRNRATHTRDYRRMASEAVEFEPITAWDGRTSVSASIKLENGKQRAIFACDTTSYFAFSYILGETEKQWRNERVILNPGAGGHIGISRRVRNCQKGGGVNLMLDYDDFNSHHATSTMKIVFEVLCEKFRAPAWLTRTLTDSFDSMYLKYDGAAHRILGTLMSGHRGTTFINSVCNAAYVRCAVGGSTFDRMLSLHAGDDVYIRCNTLSDCERILYSCKSFGCRMNPTKQSIGFVGAEFLRVAISKTASYGYYARGVAGFVSGNWTTFDPLLPAEGLSNAVAGARTLINRSGSPSLPRLLAPALRWTRGIGTRNLIGLLSGELALTGAPVFNSDGWIRNLEMKVPQITTPPPAPSWSRYATRDYLTDHVSPLEVTAINMAGVDAASLLVASSYSKGLNESAGMPTPRPVFIKVKPRFAYGFVSAIDLLDTKTERGVLSSFPILRLFESRLSEANLRELVLLAGGDHTAHNIREVAFGKTAESKNIIGALSYGDAASLSQRTSSDNIFSLHPVYV
uniref:RNA-directed RNA polymerase n=1 Tax=Hymenoscyphus albidus victorivirus 1 TaxID=3074143 RepID=A0AA51YIA2_9VIRU|nr:RdRp [Hymenoscyphus albidus victorivirus 1]